MSTELAVPKELETGLAKLRAEAEAIVVTNQTQYIEAAQIENSAKSYIKDVKAKLGPGIASAKDHLDFLKNDMAKYTNPAELVLATIQKKRLGWAEEEKRKAQAEQDRINAENRRKAQEVADAERKERERLAEENRKKEQKEIEAARRAGDVGKREAERLKKEADEKAARERAAAAEEARKAAENVQAVTVKPSVPVVAGVKNQTFFFAEVTNGGEIIKQFVEAMKSGNYDRATFLSRFVCVDEKEVGQFARDTKDNAKATAQVPGVRFWSKG